MAEWVGKNPAAIMFVGRYKRVIGDALRSRTDETEVAIAARDLNQMVGCGRPKHVRTV
jgi:hypothetical protein